MLIVTTRIAVQNISQYMRHLRSLGSCKSDAAA
jgi:hypothetical protein